MMQAVSQSAHGPWEETFLIAKYLMLGNPAEEGHRERLAKALEEDSGKYSMVLELAAHAVDLPDGWADMKAAELDDPLANMPELPPVDDEN